MDSLDAELHLTVLQEMALTCLEQVRRRRKQLSTYNLNFLMRRMALQDRREKQDREAAGSQLSLRGIMSSDSSVHFIEECRRGAGPADTVVCPFWQTLNFLKLTGLSASVQTPAPAQWKTSFYIAIHVGALWMSHAWAASTEARRTQLSVTFLSTQLESVRPLLNPSDEPRCPRGAFLLHSASRWDFIRPLIVLDSAHTVLMRPFTRGAAWLTLTSWELTAEDGWMLQYEPDRLTQGGLGEGGSFATHRRTHTRHTLPMFMRSQLDYHVMDYLPVSSLLIFVCFWESWIRLMRLAAVQKKQIRSAFQTLMWCLSFCNYSHIQSTGPH